ncbi:MAG TPA: deoxyribodipyrimidine photo-lyase [Acidobacteriaceae bacterium]|nr:deoxyribodipyrimidine photo-lyase [Acidobacteriaceae bacterium]
MPLAAQPSAIVWFRLDLRLRDNPALQAAVDSGLPVVPLFVWSPERQEPFGAGAASRWWLHQALLRLEDSLRAKGSRLILRRGPAAEAIAALAQQCGARHVFCNRVYEPAARECDLTVEDRLRTHGIALEKRTGNLLFEPGTLRTAAGSAFQVFTPFWRALWARRGEIRSPHDGPTTIPSPAKWPSSLDIRELNLEPKIGWAAGLRAAWTPGEDAARARLQAFAGGALRHYGGNRDRMDLDETSRLSPHLHFGEVSAVQAWHRAIDHPGAEAWLRQLAWREFAYHLLAGRPESLTEPLNAQFRSFPWRRNRSRLTAWQKGRTGYPVVDAGMRQLWATGWMHNRARLIAASFLVKDLLIPWQEGAAWFLDTLVDADLANNNTMGWQWVAGCGADAAPYFRVFNPVLQGEKFDPDGEYVRRWVPELAKLPAQWIHQPWNAPPLLLAEAGVRLGRNYPHPFVDHGDARQAALAAYEEMKRAEAKR